MSEAPGVYRADAGATPFGKIFIAAAGEFASTRVEQGPANFDYTSDFYLTLSWPTNDDPERPHKLSKNLKLVITMEVVLAYKAFGLVQRERVLKKLEDELSARFASYDPIHQEEENTPPPTETWTLGMAEIGV